MTDKTRIEYEVLADFNGGENAARRFAEALNPIKEKLQWIEASIAAANRGMEDFAEAHQRNRRLATYSSGDADTAAMRAQQNRQMGVRNTNNARFMDRLENADKRALDASIKMYERYYQRLDDLERAHNAREAYKTSRAGSTWTPADTRGLTPYTRAVVNVLEEFPPSVRPAIKNLVREARGGRIDRSAVMEQLFVGPERVDLFDSSVRTTQQRRKQLNQISLAYQLRLAAAQKSAEIEQQETVELMQEAAARKLERSLNAQQRIARSRELRRFKRRELPGYDLIEDPTERARQFEAYLAGPGVQRAFGGRDIDGLREASRDLDVLREAFTDYETRRSLKERRRAAAATAGSTRSDADIEESARQSARVSEARMKVDGGASVFRIQTDLMRNYMVMAGALSTITAGAGFVVQYEAELAQLQAIAAATNGEMKDLEKTIGTVAQSSKFMAVEIVQASTLMAQAGLSARDIDLSLQSVINLATGTGTDLSTTVDVVTSTLSVFKLQTSEAAAVADTLTSAMNRTKLTVDRYALGLQYAGNVAADSGISYLELTQALAGMANQGIRAGSTLGTGLRQLLIDLQTPTDKARAHFKELGISMSDLDVRTNGLFGVLRNLRQAGFTTADAMETLEVRSASAYAAMSNDLGRIESLRAALLQTGTAADAASTQLDTIAAKTTKTLNSAGVGLDAVSNPVQLLVKALLDLTNVLLKVTTAAAPFLQFIFPFLAAAVASSVTKGLYDLGDGMGLFGNRTERAATVSDRLRGSLDRVTRSYTGLTDAIRTNVRASQAQLDAANAVANGARNLDPRHDRIDEQYTQQLRAAHAQTQRETVERERNISAYDSQRKMRELAARTDARRALEAFRRDIAAYDTAMQQRMLEASAQGQREIEEFRRALLEKLQQDYRDNPPPGPTATNGTRRNLTDPGGPDSPMYRQGSYSEDLQRNPAGKIRQGIWIDRVRVESEIERFNRDPNYLPPFADTLDFDKKEYIRQLENERMSLLQLSQMSDEMLLKRQASIGAQQMEVAVAQRLEQQLNQERAAREAHIATLTNEEAINQRLQATLDQEATARQAHIATLTTEEEIFRRAQENIAQADAAREAHVAGLNNAGAATQKLNVLQKAQIAISTAATQASAALGRALQGIGTATANVVAAARADPIGTLFTGLAVVSVMMAAWDMFVPSAAKQVDELNTKIAKLKGEADGTAQSIDSLHDQMRRIADRSVMLTDKTESLADRNVALQDIVDETRIRFGALGLQLRDNVTDVQQLKDATNALNIDLKQTLASTSALALAALNAKAKALDAQLATETSSGKMGAAQPRGLFDARFWGNLARNVFMPGDNIQQMQGMLALKNNKELGPKLWPLIQQVNAARQMKSKDDNFQDEFEKATQALANLSSQLGPDSTLPKGQQKALERFVAESRADMDTVSKILTDIQVVNIERAPIIRRLADPTVLAPEAYEALTNRVSATKAEFEAGVREIHGKDLAAEETVELLKKLRNDPRFQTLLKEFFGEDAEGNITKDGGQYKELVEAVTRSLIENKINPTQRDIERAAAEARAIVDEDKNVLDMRRLLSGVTTGRLDQGLSDEGRKNQQTQMEQEERTLKSEEKLLISRSRGKERKSLEESLKEAKDLSDRQAAHAKQMRYLKLDIDPEKMDNLSRAQKIDLAALDLENEQDAERLQNAIRQNYDRFNFDGQRGGPPTDSIEKYIAAQAVQVAREKLQTKTDQISRTDDPEQLKKLGQEIDALFAEYIVARKEEFKRGWEDKNWNKPALAAAVRKKEEDNLDVKLDEEHQQILAKETDRLTTTIVNAASRALKAVEGALKGIDQAVEDKLRPFRQRVAALQGFGNRGRIGNTEMQKAEEAVERARIDFLPGKINAKETQFKILMGEEYQMRQNLANADDPTARIALENSLNDIIQRRRDLQAEIKELIKDYTANTAVQVESGFFEGWREQTGAAIEQWSRSSGVLQSAVATMADGIKEALSSARGAFSNFVRDIVTGSLSAGDAVREMGIRIMESLMNLAIEMLTNEILKWLIKMLASLFTASASASPISSGSAPAPPPLVNVRPIGMSGGGRVTGGIPGVDSVPALLMPGEYVVKKSAVDMLGPAALEELNRTGRLSGARVAGAAGSHPMIKQREPDQVNIYMMPPDEKPQLGEKDVLMVLQRDIINGGPTKRLIKQIAVGG